MTEVINTDNCITPNKVHLGNYCIAVTPEGSVYYLQRDDANTYRFGVLNHCGGAVGSYDTIEKLIKQAQASKMRIFIFSTRKEMFDWINEHNPDGSN